MLTWDTGRCESCGGPCYPHSAALRDVRPARPVEEAGHRRARRRVEGGRVVRRSALTLVAGLAVLAVAAPADAEAGGDWRTLAQTSKFDAHAQRMINMPGVFRLNVSAPKGRVYVDIEYTCDFEQVDGDSVEKYPMMRYWSHWSRGFELPDGKNDGYPAPITV